MNNKDFRIVILEKESEFLSIRKEWNRLVIKSGSFFLGWEQSYAWWNYYGKSFKLRIICVENYLGEIRAILPMCLVETSFSNKLNLNFKLLRNFGFGGAYYDMLGLICKRSEKSFFWQLLTDYFYLDYHREWNIISLNNFSDWKMFVDLQQNRKYIISLSNKHSCPELVLNNFNIGEKKFFNKKLINKWELLKKEEVFSVDFVHPKSTLEADIYLQILKKFISKQTKKRLISKNYFYWSFISSLLINSYKNVIFPVILDTNNFVISIHMLFKYGKTVYGYQMSYDREISKKYELPFGRILLMEIASYLHKSSYSKFNLMVGEEGYKMNIADYKNDIFDILIFNSNFKSRLLFLLILLNRKIRNVIQDIRKTKIKLF